MQTTKTTKKKSTTHEHQEQRSSEGTTTITNQVQQLGKEDRKKAELKPQQQPEQEQAATDENHIQRSQYDARARLSSSRERQTERITGSLGELGGLMFGDAAALLPVLAPLPLPALVMLAVLRRPRMPLRRLDMVLLMTARVSHNERMLRGTRNSKETTQR